MTESIDTPASTGDLPATSVESAVPRKQAAITGGELLGVPLLWLAKLALFMACLGIFWNTVISFSDRVFPNRSGLNDLDHSEIAFYGLWIFLTWRYLAKVFRYQSALHRAVYRYVIAFGVHAMCFSSITKILPISLHAKLALSGDFQDLVAITSELTWLLLLFAIVPKGKLILPDTEDKLEQVSNEPPESAAR